MRYILGVARAWGLRRQLANPLNLIRL